MSSSPSSPQGRKIDRDDVAGGSHDWWVDLCQRREEKLADFLATATRALEGKKEYERAQDALDQATLLNPDDSRVVALWPRMDAARPAWVDALLRDARRQVKDRSLESAAQLIDHAIEVMPDSDAAVQLRDDVRKRLRAAGQARTVWRLAAGAAVGTLFVAAAALTLLRSADPFAAVRATLENAEEAMDAGRYRQAVALYSEALRVDPENAAAASAVSVAAAALEAERRETIEALSARAREANQSFGTVQGQVRTDLGLGEADTEGPTDADATDVALEGEPDSAAAAVPVPPAPTNAAPTRPAPVAVARRDAPGAAQASAPTVVARLCNQGSACGMLTLRVEPAATILFNGVAVGTGAQGVLRLPAGRHQIRLESEGYQFRRMVNIAGDAPATLEVDLEDEGLPLSQ